MPCATASEVFSQLPDGIDSHQCDDDLRFIIENKVISEEGIGIKL